jgi:hypothetical protein
MEEISPGYTVAYLSTTPAAKSTEVELGALAAKKAAQVVPGSPARGENSHSNKIWASRRTSIDTSRTPFIYSFQGRALATSN